FISPSKYRKGFWISGCGQLKSTGKRQGFIIKTDSIGTPLLAKEINADTTIGLMYNASGPIVEGDDYSLYFTTVENDCCNPAIALFIKTDSLLNKKWV